MTSNGTNRRAGRWIAPVTALLQLLAFLPFLLSGLIAPPGGVLGLRLLWVAFAVLAVIVYRRNPRLSLAVPGVTVLTGVACLFVGGAVLGWQG